MDDSISAASEDQEKQQFPRRAVLMAATLVVAEQHVPCEVLNISEGGAKIRLKGEIVFQPRVVLYINEFAFEADVVWHTDDNMGLKFLMSPEAVGKVINGPLSAASNPRERRDHTWRSVLMSGKLMADGRETECVVCNISLAGAQIRVKAALDYGQRLNLRIDRFGIFPAEVVWVDGENIGLRFLIAPAAVSAMVGDFLPGTPIGSKKSDPEPEPEDGDEDLSDGDGDGGSWLDQTDDEDPGRGRTTF